MALGHSAAEAAKIVKTGSNTPLDGSWLQMHLGDPGAAGTANQALVTARKQITLGTVTVGSAPTSAPLTWGTVSATEDPTHYSLWTLEVSGVFLFSGLLDAGTGYTVGNSFVIDAGSLTITQTTVAA